MEMIDELAQWLEEKEPSVFTCDGSLDPSDRMYTLQVGLYWEPLDRFATPLQMRYADWWLEHRPNWPDVLKDISPFLEEMKIV